jgi:hypothetical protein
MMTGDISVMNFLQVTTKWSAYSYKLASLLFEIDVNANLAQKHHVN